MTEKPSDLPPNYWREGLKRFSLHQDEYLQNTPRDTSWIDELPESEAQKALEALERIQVLINNTFPLYGVGDGDGAGEGLDGE